MIMVQFPDSETKRRAWGLLAGRSSFTTWASGEVLVPDAALPALAHESHFISKLTDCDGEKSETDTSLDFAHDCGYLTDEQHAQFTRRHWRRRVRAEMRRRCPLGRRRSSRRSS